MRLVLTAIFLLAFAQPVSAELRENEAPPMTELFAVPCLELGIPCPVAMAIARVESGLHPWSLNIAGQSFRFKSKAEALAKARTAFSAGGSLDVGLMQVNSWWLKRYEIPLEAALDPLGNIYLGGWILKPEISRHKDLRAAVGAYHSPNPDKARRYANVVMAALKRGPVQSSKVPPKSQPKTTAASAPKSAPKQAAPDNHRMVVNRDQSSRYSFSSPTPTSSTMKVRSKIK